MPIEVKKLDAKKETIFDAFFRKPLPEQIREAAEFVVRSVRGLIYARKKHPSSAPSTPSADEGATDTNQD